MVFGKKLEWTDRAGNKLFSSNNPVSGKTQFELLNAEGKTVNEKDTLRVLRGLGLNLSRETKKDARGVATYIVKK